MKQEASVNAKLVWDGGAVMVPAEMGVPRPDQLQGTPHEVLSELGGRVCYDSVGSGRSSADYHKHIQEVGHLSVYEHAQMTVDVRAFVGPSMFLNRPGFWVELRPSSTRVTFNPRAIVEWNRWNGSNSVGLDGVLLDILSFYAEAAYPMILKPRHREAVLVDGHRSISEVVTPEADEEKWVSMYMVMSRGCSHEIVRHGNFTGISQRSTRFVNEADSAWVDHPLVTEFLASSDPLPEDPDNRIRGALGGLINDLKASSRYVYEMTVKQLQPWLTAKGADKLTARKQARGAARGYLGNALSTEMIFSASVGQWKRMLRMRACAAADAEIRELFVKALGELQKSRYSADFSAFTLKPASDGIGQVAAESV